MCKNFSKRALSKFNLAKPTIKVASSNYKNRVVAKRAGFIYKDWLKNQHLQVITMKMT